MSDLAQLIRTALNATNRAADVLVFPTILAEWPSTQIDPVHTVLIEDVALSFLTRAGFKCARAPRGEPLASALNQSGYPRLLRDLMAPPPWVKVEPEEQGLSLSVERSVELRPLYVQANENSTADLVTRFHEHRVVLNRTARELELESVDELAYVKEALALDDFEDQIGLARCLGIETFESLCEVVFEYDEFTLAVGAPDLFVWEPESECWFFVEIKGPGDHLRRSQADWVRANWNDISGRFVLLVVPSLG